MEFIFEKIMRSIFQYHKLLKKNYSNEFHCFTFNIRLNLNLAFFFLILNFLISNEKYKFN